MYMQGLMSLNRICASYSRWRKQSKLKGELLRAIREHCVTCERIRCWLDCGMDPNLVLKRDSLLTCVMAMGHPAVVTLLLERGARFDSPGNDRFLMFATLQANKEMVALGCKHGLDINHRPRRSLLPLEIAISGNDMELIDCLFRLGARGDSLRRVRWFAVSSRVILRLAEWGTAVPNDVLQAAKNGEWGDYPL
jgi:hypothetical protein